MGVTRCTGNRSLVVKHLLRPVKRATWTDFVAKSRTTLYFLQQLFTTYNNPVICNLVPRVRVALSTGTGNGSRSLSLTKRIAASGNEIGWFVAREVWFIFVRQTPPLHKHLRVDPCCPSVICFWIVTEFVLDRYRIQLISHASHLV